MATSFKRNEVDGFLNLEVRIDGQWMKLNKGAPLYASNGVTAKILAQAEEDPNFEFLIKGSVFLMSSKEEEDPKEAKFESFDFAALDAPAKEVKKEVAVEADEVPF